MREFMFEAEGESSQLPAPVAKPAASCHVLPPLWTLLPLELTAHINSCANLGHSALSQQEKSNTRVLL